MTLHLPHHRANDPENNQVLLVIEILAGVVLLGEITSAVAQFLHLQESSNLIHLADIALGSLCTFLVHPKGGKRLTPRIHRALHRPIVPTPEVPHDLPTKQPDAVQPADS